MSNSFNGDRKRKSFIFFFLGGNDKSINIRINETINVFIEYVGIYKFKKHVNSFTS